MRKHSQRHSGPRVSTLKLELSLKLKLILSEAYHQPVSQDITLQFLAHCTVTHLTPAKVNTNKAKWEKYCMIKISNDDDNCHLNIWGWFTSTLDILYQSKLLKLFQFNLFWPHEVLMERGSFCKHHWTPPFTLAIICCMQTDMHPFAKYGRKLVQI